MIDNLQFILVAVQAIGTMLAVGLELSPAELRQTLSNRRALTLGVVLNLIILPLITALLLMVVPIPKAVAAGLLFAAASAGSSSAVLLTRNVKGDTSYAVAMLCVLSLLSLITLPPLLGMVSGILELVPLPAGAVTVQVLQGMLYYTIGPLAIGMAIRAKMPGLAARWAKPLALIASLCLLILIIGLLITHGRDLSQFAAASLAVTLLVVSIGFALARIIAKPGMALGRAALYAFGIRNLSLALIIAAQLQLSALTTLSILSYGMMMYLGGGALFLVLRKQPLDGETSI
jgi:BASS family bile acid:Na+ symporter